MKDNQRHVGISQETLSSYKHSNTVTDESVQGWDRPKTVMSKVKQKAFTLFV